MENVANRMYQMAQAEFSRGMTEEAIRLCDRSLQMHTMDKVREFREKIIKERDGAIELRDADIQDLVPDNMYVRRFGCADITAYDMYRIFVHGRKASIDQVDFPLVPMDI